MLHPGCNGKPSLEIAARTELIVLNTGSPLTFRCSVWEGSFPDVILTYKLLVSLMDRWRVLEDLSASEHQYIVFEAVDAISWCAPARRFPCFWDIAKANIGIIVEALLCS